MEREENEKEPGVRRKKRMTWKVRGRPRVGAKRPRPVAKRAPAGGAQRQKQRLGGMPRREQKETAVHLA